MRILQTILRIPTWILVVLAFTFTVWFGIAYRVGQLDLYRACVAHEEAGHE